MDFKIGYDLPADNVKAYLKAVYQRACQATDGLSDEDNPRIALKENGDHAVRWRLAYVLRSPHQLLIAARCGEFGGLRIAGGVQPAVARRSPSRCSSAVDRELGLFFGDLLGEVRENQIGTRTLNRQQRFIPCRRVVQPAFSAAAWICAYSPDN